MLGLGAYSLYAGTSLVVSSLATGSMAALGLGLLYGAVGCYDLENYNVRPLWWGVGESSSTKLQTSGAMAWSMPSLEEIIEHK